MTLDRAARSIVFQSFLEIGMPSENTSMDARLPYEAPSVCDLGPIAEVTWGVPSQNIPDDGAVSV